MKKQGTSFGAIVALIGSILISIGFAWLIAQNWHQIPSLLKIIILLGLTSGAFVAGTVLIKKDYLTVGKAILVLGSLLYTLSIFLIAQIFFVRGGWQGIAVLWLIAWIGVIAFSYIFDSSASLFIGLIEIIVWIVIQFLAFTEQTTASLGILAFYFLALGVLFYGLNLLHHYKEHRFARIYRWWTAFYFLAFTYLLSFQLLLPNIWPKEVTTPTSAMLFLVFLAIIALAPLVWKITLVAKKKKPNFKEIYGFIGLVVLLIVLISSTSFVSGIVGTCNVKTCDQVSGQQSCEALPNYLKCQWENNLCQDKSCYRNADKNSCEKQSSCTWYGYCNEKFSCYTYTDESSCRSSPVNLGCTWEKSYCYNKDPCVSFNSEKSCSQQSICNWYSQSYGGFGNNGNYPISLWALWIIVNLFFIGLIIGIIGYGTWQKMPSLINLGIVFFALDIITRYIGFILDFRGYVGLSVFFIIGGVLLLGGGWLVERWRKKLLASAK